jgi:hypothetical protein
MQPMPCRVANARALRDRVSGIVDQCERVESRFIQTDVQFGQTGRRPWYLHSPIELLTPKLSGKFRMRLLMILRPPVFFTYWSGEQASFSDLADVVIELATGCASSAWVLSLYALHSWLACLFPERAQQELFLKSGYCLISSPAGTGIAQPVNGGFKLAGRWSLGDRDTSLRLADC